MSSDSNCSVGTVNFEYMFGLYPIFAQHLFGNIIVNIFQLKGIHLSELVQSGIINFVEKEIKGLQSLLKLLLAPVAAQ